MAISTLMFTDTDRTGTVIAIGRNARRPDIWSRVVRNGGTYSEWPRCPLLGEIRREWTIERAEVMAISQEAKQYLPHVMKQPARKWDQTTEAERHSRFV